MNITYFRNAFCLNNMFWLVFQTGYRDIEPYDRGATKVDILDREPGVLPL